MLRIAKSVVIIVAVVALATSATRAYFTDQVVAAGNTVSAGTLTLNVNGSNEPAAVFHAANMSPGGPSGWTTAVGAGGVALKNTGSIKGHAWFEITNIVVTGGNGDGSLANRIKPVIQLNQAPWGVTYVSGISLNNLNGYRVDVADLNAGETINIFAYNLWPESTPAVDNLAQGQTATYDVVFHLDQV